MYVLVCRNNRLAHCILRFLWILHQAQCVMVQITVNRFIHFREPFYTAYHIVTSLRYESFITVFNLPVIIINPI